MLKGIAVIAARRDCLICLVMVMTIERDAGIHRRRDWAGNLVQRNHHEIPGELQGEQEDDASGDHSLRS